MCADRNVLERGVSKRATGRTNKEQRMPLKWTEFGWRLVSGLQHDHDLSGHESIQGVMIDVTTNEENPDAQKHWPSGF